MISKMTSVVNQSPDNDKGWILRPVALDGFSFPWPTFKKEITKEVSENEEEVDEDDIPDQGSSTGLLIGWPKMTRDVLI